MSIQNDLNAQGKDNKSPVPQRFLKLWTLITTNQLDAFNISYKKKIRNVLIEKLGLY